jgi:hypothetical protein
VVSLECPLPIPRDGMTPEMRSSAVKIAGSLEDRFGVRVVLATVVQHEESVCLSGLFLRRQSEYLNPRRVGAYWQRQPAVADLVEREAITRVSLYDAVSFFDGPCNAKTVVEHYRKLFGEPLLFGDRLGSLYDLLDGHASTTQKQLQLIDQVRRSFITHNCNTWSTPYLQAAVMARIGRLPRYRDVTDAEAFADPFLDTHKGRLRDYIPWNPEEHPEPAVVDATRLDLKASAGQWKKRPYGSQAAFEQSARAWLRDAYESVWNERLGPAQTDRGAPVEPQQTDEFQL